MGVLNPNPVEARGAAHAASCAKGLGGDGVAGPVTAQRRGDPVDRHIGWRLYQRRMRLGYSQSELARTLGVSFQLIHKYERASSRISAARLWAIAGALDVDVHYFYSGFQDPAQGG
ncbi:hypothetical protein BH10PSE1_BH10PSE1_19110 [soil metagenome]